MEYQHTQTGYRAIILIGGLLFTVVVLVSASDDSEGAVFAVGALFLLLGLLGIVFGRLTVTVGSGSVRTAFGWGWPHRSVEIRNIAAIRPVRNQWYYGWGIRRIPRGWMYNVWGLDAVELELHSGGIFRIGTDQPEELLEALSRHSTLRPPGTA